MSSATGSPTVVALKPARTFPNANVMHGIRFSCRQGATPANEDAIPSMPLATQIHFGTIPKGAVITNIQLHVRTLFNGTTPLFIIGTIADDDALATSAEAVVTAVARLKNLGLGVLMGYTPTDMQVYAKLTAAGNTAGELHAVVEYYPPKT
jgi:hypothetical protein